MIEIKFAKIRVRRRQAAQWPELIYRMAARSLKGFDYYLK